MKFPARQANVVGDAWAIIWKTAADAIHFGEKIPLHIKLEEYR